MMRRPIRNRAKPLVAFMLVYLGTLFGSSAEQKKPQNQPEETGTIRVNVEMVSLPVVVTTRDGKRITDLRKEDFHIYEDGVEQEIAAFAATDEPVTLALALDTSGSTEMKLATIQREAIRFVNLLHPDDSVAIMSFSEDVNLLEDFSIDREKNAYGIKETRPGGSTVLYEAVWLGLEELLKPIKERHALVLFTDGVDTASRKASEKETLDLAKETQSTIYSVYYNTEEDLNTMSRRGPTVGGYPFPGGTPPIILGGPTLGSPIPGGSRSDYFAGRKYLQELAENSGGMVYDALKNQDLSAAFEGIAKELSSQYSLGYYPNSARNASKFRKVEVKVSRPGLVVRTKKGYTPRKK